MEHGGSFPPLYGTSYNIKSLVFASVATLNDIQVHGDESNRIDLPCRVWNEAPSSLTHSRMMCYLQQASHQKKKKKTGAAVKHQRKIMV